MSNNDLDEAIRDEVEESFKKISNFFCNCNHNYLYKYYTFNSNYIDDVIRTIDMNFIFLSKLALFEKDDIHEYQLLKKYFKDGIKPLIERYNDSTIRDTTKIICLSYEYPNEYLIKNYCKNFGFIIKYNANKLTEYMARRYKGKLIYDDVTYVENKSEFISKKYNESFSEYPNRLKEGIQARDNYTFSKITHDVINDICYHLNSTNFLIKDNCFCKEKEFRFVLTNIDENEKYVYLKDNSFIDEIIILDSNIVLFDKIKMYELINICKKNKINYKLEKLA